MSVMDGLSGRGGAEAPAADSPFDAFWQWFRSAEARLREAHGGGTAKLEAAVNEIGDRLRRVHPELCFEYGQADDGVYELILSAGGIRSLFPAVAALRQAAPEVPGWRIVAFRPRKAACARVQLGEAVLEPEGLWYRLMPDTDHADLDLFVAGLTPETLEGLGGAAFLMLDAALGEYDVATRIGAIDFDALPEDPAGLDLKPIGALRADFDALFPQTKQ
ncbi:MAG: hypothetical protein QNJ30_08790 [Kiloniellales bacterium]|nr:hypothetical protein [Kiloniellales bacterium]